MKFQSRICVWAALMLLASIGAGRSVAEPGRLTVHVDQPGVKISPMFYGLMTEEINHAYDGGRACRRSR